MKKMRRPQAFTLIELLVVIAIIAILAAILFPVYARMKEKARQTTCISDLKQVGLAFAQYEGDYDEFLPWGLDFFDKTSWLGGGTGDQAFDSLLAGNRTLDVVLNEYIRNHELWHCPSDNGGTLSWYSPGNVPTNWPCQLPPGKSSFYDAFGMSYLYNTRLILERRTLGSFKRPCDITVLHDAAGYWHSRFKRPPQLSTGSDLTDQRYWGYNVLFADGHVKNETSGAAYLGYQVR
jgi:prepilin-type N-terminal cleavage/methylation domain-containing protein/prepilin-type processing-associated H-X9-DG protein